MPQVISKILTGVVVLSVTLAGGPAKAEPPLHARSVVVLDRTELNGEVKDAHQQLQTAVDGAVRAAGWDSIPAAAPTAACDETLACLKAAAETSGASVVIRIAGGRNTNDGYDLEAQIWRADGGPSQRIVGSCASCLTDDMARTARKMVRDLLVDAGTPPPPPPSPPPAALPEAQKADALVTIQPSAAGPRSGSRLTTPVIVGVGSAVVLVAGASIWALDGHSASHCTSPAMGSQNCDVYNTRTVGPVLTLAGAAGAVVAGVLFFRVLHNSHEVSVSVGPSGVAMGSRF